MDKEDARYLSPDQQHERRKQVVRLHKAGHRVMDIVKLCGLSYPTVRKAIDDYEAGGAAAIRSAPRGRNPGDGRSLSPEQEDLVRRTICDKRPEQLKMDFALWTRGAVMQLIEQQCGIALSIRAVGNYLKRWGFTPQKPIKRAYEQQPEAVKAWLHEQYPAIEARAKAEGGEVHWGDETALVNTDVRGRSYAPRGQTPVTRSIGGTRQKLSMSSTVNNRGKAHWMIIDGAFNHERLIEFLQALAKEGRREGKKVFLILDNLGVHHCKPVKAWLAEHKHEIEVFYLPSYSPELNPNEMANADLKQAVTKLAPARTKLQLVKATSRHLRSVQRQPERIKSYFQHEPVRYAA